MTITRILIVCAFLSVCSLRSQTTKLTNEQLKDSIDEYLVITGTSFDTYNFSESLNAANKGIKLAKIVNDKYALATFYNDIAIIYETISDIDKAKNNYLLALQYANEIENDTLRSWFTNNLGNIYSEGYKKIDSALYYYNQSLQISKKINDSSEMFTPKLNIGWTYVDEKAFDKAYPYLIESEQMISSKQLFISEIEENSAKAQVSYLLARYHMAKQNTALSDSYFQKSIALAKENNLYSELSEIYEYYSQLAANQLQFEAAHNRLQLHLQYKDSVFNIKKQQELQVIQARYDLDNYKSSLERMEAEKEDQRVILRQSRQISYIFMITGLILILLLINVFRNYRFRNKALKKLRVKNLQLREAKEEAEQQANLKAQFFSTVSHELRTPLYGVVGLTSLMEEDFKELRKDENFKSLKFSSKYLLSLINNVLQINKIESEGVKLEKVPFNIRNLVNQVIHSFNYAVHQNNNQVHQEIDSEIPEVLLGDSVRLSQILMNLIGNAIKFTENGNIWIRLRLSHQNGAKHGIEFSIKDDGIGIPKDKQQAVFEKFVQLKPIEKNYQGTGLGLSIVRRLLSLFGSGITLESKEGKGAEFIFDIIFEESQEELQVDALGTTEEIDTKNKKILVVDDNKINQVVTKRILSTKGYQCDIAGNGFEALEKLKNDTFDLILMDINMPEIDGIETTRRIRKTNKIIPIIALTAVEESQIKDNIFEVGMNDFIIKPYDIQEFHQIVLKNLFAKST